MHIVCQTYTGKCSDHHVCEVHLTALKSVTRGAWESMMIVVPALPQRQDAD